MSTLCVSERTKSDPEQPIGTDCTLPRGHVSFFVMGAWGPGIYDNDGAADWSAEVAELGLQAVEAALEAVIEAEYVEAPDAACAMAAADVVARLVSGRGENSAYCEDIVAWVDANAAPPAPSLVAKAAQAVGRVPGDDSELAELWSEDASSLAARPASLADVEQRLCA